MPERLPRHRWRHARFRGRRSGDVRRRCRRTARPPSIAPARASANLATNFAGPSASDPGAAGHARSSFATRASITTSSAIGSPTSTRSTAAASPAGSRTGPVVQGAGRPAGRRRSPVCRFYIPPRTATRTSSRRRPPSARPSSRRLRPIPTTAGIRSKQPTCSSSRCPTPTTGACRAAHRARCTGYGTSARTPITATRRAPRSRRR